jgi:hypothetical protein
MGNDIDSSITPYVCNFVPPFQYIFCLVNMELPPKRDVNLYSMITNVLSPPP